MAEKEEHQSQVGDDLVKRDVITRDDLHKARQFERTTGIPWYRQLLQAGKIGFSALEDSLHHEFHPRSKRAEHKNLGRTLLSMKAITEDQLEAALTEQNRSGRLLGQILLDQGWVTRRSVSAALAKQYNMEFAELEETPSEKKALEAIPESLARKNQMIPVRLEGDKLTVLVTDPQMRLALKDTGVMLGLRMRPMLTCVDDVKEEIAKRYHPISRAIPILSSIAERMTHKEEKQPKAPPPKKPAKKAEIKAKPTKGQKGKRTVAKKEDETAIQTDKKMRDKLRFDEIAKQASGMPVIKLVQTIIEGAVNSGATDVHLDPQEPEMRVRFRIDGVLHDVMSIPAEIESAVVSRVKIMADLDISKTRHPQDGHISMEINEGEFDIRVATLPTFAGERIVLRLLDQTSVLAGIRDLGLEGPDEKKLRALIEQPYGMILVTGPTGSGKTTTLYAALNQKNVLEDSIVTLEDPVEYQLSGINQVQIDADIGVTFANTLRAALRQDIDVLLVGEIRDPETARIAIRAAMTGHLVFSTMHTNDAPEAIHTLLNMGVPAYLISSALTAVLAQRLVRTICPDCKKAFTPTKTLLQSVGLPQTTKKLYRGAGCDNCYHTGNKGRSGVFELLEITPQIRQLIAAGEPTEKLVKTAKLKTMAENCRLKMKDGLIAPEEFLRVIRT